MVGADPDDDPCVDGHVVDGDADAGVDLVVRESTGRVTRRA